MEFQYSTLVNPSTVVASGCFTTLPVRFHRDEKLAIRGSKQMEVDWQLAFGKPAFSPGCQNPRGHLAATSLPESLPDRIAISAYIMDYMLHHDDIADLQISTAKEEHSALSEVLKPRTDADVESATTRKERFQAEMLKELSAIDEIGAKSLVRVWKQYAIISAEGMDMKFPTMREYLPYRMKEAGIPLFLAIASYASDIKITEAEEESVRHIMTPISLSMALVNDYFSWDKEYYDYMQKGDQGRLYSSIKLLMDEHHVSATEAKEMVCEMIVQYEREYTREKERWLATGERPLELRRYVDNAALMAAGSLYWHSSAPRYHDFLPKPTGAKQRLVEELYTQRVAVAS
ncbi:MAG: hypothetical protein Q9193_004261 [Seirophora villosa]